MPSPRTCEGKLFCSWSAGPVCIVSLPQGPVQDVRHGVVGRNAASMVIIHLGAGLVHQEAKQQAMVSIIRGRKGTERGRPSIEV